MTATPRTLAAPNAVCDAVLAYIGDGAGVLPVATIRDDIARIVQQHPDSCTVHFTPRGHHGAGDFEVFDYDAQQTALVTVYADGRVEALPVIPAEIVADEEAEVPDLMAELRTSLDAAIHHRHGVTVYYRGRAMTARRVEHLPSGDWRADLPGGLIALYATDPTDDPSAVQRTA